jgi:hypothetical protein
MVSYCASRANINLLERNLVAWIVYDSIAFNTSVLGRSEIKCAVLVLKNLLNEELGS